MHIYNFKIYKMKVTARLLCRKGKNVGNIQIIAYYKNQQKEISLGRKVPKDLWDVNRGLMKGKEYDMLNVSIRNAIRDISHTIDKRMASGHEVDLDEVFKTVFYKEEVVKSVEQELPITLKSFVLDYITENPDKIKQSSMNNYRSLLSVMEGFPDVPLNEVNVRYVNEFYDYLKKRDVSQDTIQTRFKKLKKIISSAIARGLTSEYPFGKGKLTIPTSKVVKRKFLSSEEVEKLLEYQPTNVSESKVMSIIRFNLHVGMRIADIFTLRKNQLREENHPTKGKVIRLVKTTSKTETDINVLLTKQAMDQVLASGYQEKTDQDFIFDWLKESDFESEKSMYRAISSKTAYFNKVLGEICKKVGIKHISSHALRHTFCTTLVSKGVPVTSIAKLVGHTDIATTMIYAQILQDAADDAISVLED